MNGLLRAITFIFLALLLVGGNLVWASQAVRVVEDLGDTQASFSCQKQINGTSISVEIPAVEMKTITVNSTEYKEVSLPAAEYLVPAQPGNEGDPDLPAFSSLVVIPDQEGVELSVTYSGYDTFEGIDIAPVQPSPADNDPNAPIPFTQNETLYSTDAFFPEQLAVSAEPVIMRDVRAVQVQINPVQYNPVRHELRIYRDLSVSLTYGGAVVNPKLTRTSYLSDGFYPLYKATFANFEDFFANVEVKRGGYMIICKPALADSLKPLAAWKHQKGYSVRIVKTTDIATNPTSTQIFNYIRTAYQTWADPPEYVMIVGDKDGTFLVPDYPYSSYASDHHYACVDGTDWLPDIFVARLSVDLMSEFRVAVSKIFKYEKTPLMRDSEHWIRGLSCGWTLFNTARYTTLWVRSLALRNGFARVDTVYGGSADPRLTTYMNSGPAYIWYRGEGGSDGWWGISYSISDLMAMPNNQKLGVMSPLTCGLGAFGSECFGETWIRMGLNPDSLKGGPAFYGVSDGNTHTKWNNPIMIGYFFGMFEQDIYHFAAAAVAGKMQDYRTFPGQSLVQQYFNTYNMLGDPELELRTAIPILLNVTHPDTIGFGLNHIEVNVVDTAGHVIKDAFVTLIKTVDSTEQVYSIGKTDEAGNVSLSFEAPTSGNMTLTVSGRNLYPYQSTVILETRDIAVGFDSLIIDDDTLGLSRGDGDSLANPGETLELSVSLKNFGDSLTANNVTANLTPIDAGLVEVFDGVRNYGDIPPGENLIDSRPYVIHISPNAVNGDLIRLKQTVTDEGGDSWFSVIEIPVVAPSFVISHVSVVDSVNNRLDPGDTAQLIITLINKGQKGATGVSGIITTEDDYAAIDSSLGLFGDMPVNDTSSNSTNPMVVNVALSAFPGRVVHFNLHTTTSEGSHLAIPFTVKVDSVAHTYNPSGPDAYGYYIYDKTDTLFAPHPAYSWIELAPGLGGSGTRLNFGSSTDDKSVLVQLPFNFIYYGNTYQKLIVCTNGFVSPDTTRIDMGGNYWANFFNWPIPDPGNCRAQISPFWDDLQATSSGNKGVFTWNDTTNHQFVIAWDSTTNRNTSAVETFEMVIYDPAYHPTITGDAEILYQYKTIYNTDSEENYSTVGMESWDEMDGIQYSFDNRYAPGGSTLSNTQALLITTNTGWGSIRGLVELTGGGGHNEGVVISSSSGQKRTTGDDGSFWLRNVPLGTVSISAQAEGYFPAYIDSVEVVANQAAILPEIGLDPCPAPESLLATDNLSGTINVRWRAVSDPRHTGYNVYRSRFATGGFAKLNSTPIVGTTYTDSAVPDSSIYFYYVTALYSDSIWSGESFPSGVDSGRMLATGIAGEESQLPDAFFLSQNYPNPFNPTTVISYGLPQDSRVKVEIYNLLGQKIKTLVNGLEKAGYKSLIWDGKDTAGKAVSSGVYFYRIDAGSFQASKKMMMLK